MTALDGLSADTRAADIQLPNEISAEDLVKFTELPVNKDRDARLKSYGGVLGALSSQRMVLTIH